MGKEPLEEKYKKVANEARKKVLELIFKAGTSHVSSNFSVIDLATVLYENLKEGDEVVWSKGWAAATIYYFLWKQGKITEEQLNSFPNPPFLGLAETTVPGVWCNGGSVGHGLGVAVGMALGKKRSGEKGTIYCIMSDGELNEGSVWEAVMFAAHHRLGNLVAIIDKNGWQAMGKTEDVIDMEDLRGKWNAFGWQVCGSPRVDPYRKEYADGHNFIDVEGWLNWPQVGPKVIIFETIKGKGVSFFEDKILYHYKHIEKGDFEKAIIELERNV